MVVRAKTRLLSFLLCASTRLVLQVPDRDLFELKVETCIQVHTQLLSLHWMVGCWWVTEHGLKMHKSLVGQDLARKTSARKNVFPGVSGPRTHTWLYWLRRGIWINLIPDKRGRYWEIHPLRLREGGIQTFSHHKSYPWGWIRKHILDGMYGLVESKCFCRYCQWRCFVEILLMFGREQPASSCFGRAGTMPFQTFFLSRTICTVEFVKNKDRHISTQTYTSSQYICLTQRRREKQTRRREKWSPLAAPAFSPFFLSAADAAGAGQTYRVEHFELFYCQI